MKIFLGYGYRSWTTAVYWESTLRRYAEVEYVGTDREDRQLCFQEIDIMHRLSEAQKEDVFIYIDSGKPYFPKNIEKLSLLTACYLIDVHIDLSIRIEMAKFFDVVFVAQKDYVEAFKAQGVKNVWWIPFGCQPTIYQQQKLPIIYEIGFVGHISEDMVKRKRSLSLLSRRYHINDCRRFYSPTETPSVYNGSKIIFNCSANGDLNMRVFEAMSCGRLLLTDSIANGLEELFRNRHHLVIYHDEAELLKLADYYLSKEEEREHIALCGSQLVRSQHTYDHRVKEVLNILKNTQKEKECLIAPWRNASAATVSISRSKIYAHWQLPRNILKEWLQARNARSYLWDGYYLLRTLLALLKKKLKKSLENHKVNTANCPFCGSASAKELFQAREYVFLEGKTYLMVECNNCLLVFLNPQPTEEELKRFYLPEYFHVPEDKFKAAMPSFLMLNKVKETTRFKKEGMLLDIGCGSGGFLQQMQQRGFKVQGLDLSSVACQLTSEKIGKENVFKGDLLLVNLPRRHYDVITLWNAFEHMNDPVKILNKIHTLLRDDGLLIICCPNFNSCLRLIFKEKWYPLSVPYHLLHFTPRTLTRLLEATGYNIKHRKKHFVDPLTGMVSLKESVLRFMGLVGLTKLAPSTHKETPAFQKRSFLWRTACFWFNILCFLASLTLSILGNEELIMVWAFKKSDKIKE